MDSKDALVVFQGTKIRRIWHDEQWFFSVIDIIEILTDSPTPRQYWGKIKDREFTKLELSPIWVRLKLPAEDGKLRFTDCINTQNAFRLIQSIPSKKAEPFKQWLAKVGYERVQEIENPELAQERMKQLYEQKGYSQEWIEKRIRGIAIRHASHEQNPPLKTQTPAPHMLQTPPCLSAPASRERKARLPAKCSGSRDPEHRRTGRHPGIMRCSGHLDALILM